MDILLNIFLFTEEEREHSLKTPSICISPGAKLKGLECLHKKNAACWHLSDVLRKKTRLKGNEEKLFLQWNKLSSQPSCLLLESEQLERQPQKQEDFFLQVVC